MANVGFKAKPPGDTDFHIEAKSLSAALRGETPWTSVAMTKAQAPVVYYAIPYLFIKQGSSDDDYWRGGVFWTALWMGVSQLLLRRAAARVPAAYWSVHVAINALNVLVLACALVLTFRHPGGPWLVWPIRVPWLALLAFHALFYAEPRYQLPTRPGLIVGAAALISGVLSQQNRSKVTGSSGSI